MNTCQYAKSPKLVVLGYFVENENTLGYLYKNRAGTLMLGVLAGSVIRGGHDWINGPVPVISTRKYREATQKDFDDYRVCSEGHIS